MRKDIRFPGGHPVNALERISDQQDRFEGEARFQHRLIFVSDVDDQGSFDTAGNDIARQLSE